MIRVAAFIIAGSLGLGGCATNSETPNNFTGQRTVFHNPYVAPELDENRYGPGPAGLNYPGRGRLAYDSEGNPVRLSRSERRYYRLQTKAVEGVEQAARLRAEMRAREAEAPPPPVPSAPPTAPQAMPNLIDEDPS